jgi:hypothetical protein
MSLSSQEPAAKFKQIATFAFVHLKSRRRPSIAELKAMGTSNVRTQAQLSFPFSVKLKPTPAETRHGHGRTDVTFFRLLAISTRGPV